MNSTSLEPRYKMYCLRLRQWENISAPDLEGAVVQARAEATHKGHTHLVVPESNINVLVV